MGAVYRAFDTQLEREVALKIPKSELLADTSAIKRFVREAKAAGKIRHPNICPVYEADEIDGIPFISMALIEGLRLDEWVSEHKPDHRRIAEIALATVKALTKIHEAKVVHGDIKPSNIIVDESGEPLVMDFGLARIESSYESLAQQSTVIADGLGARANEDGMSERPGLVGTVPYMSPEQIKEQPADNQTDIYSFGVVLYELLTGQLPHGSKRFGELMRQIGNDEPIKPTEINNGIDPELEAVCLRAMARERTARYQTSNELMEELAGYLATLQAKANVVSRRSRIRRLAAAAVVLIAGIITFTFTGDGKVTIVAGENTTLDGRKLKPGKHVIDAGVGSHVIVISRKDGKKHQVKIRIKWRGAAVEVQTHRIDGTVWHDINGDGLRQPSEDPLADQIVYLDLNKNGQPDDNEPQRNTDPRGDFRFEGLMPDTYVVRTPDSQVYSTDFQSNPNWKTPHGDRYRRDKQAGEFVLTQRNVNQADSEYVYHDIGLAPGSFRLELDVLLTDVSYASGVNIGLFDTDLNACDEGSFICLSFNRGDQGLIADLRCFNSEGKTTSTQSWADLRNPPSLAWLPLGLKQQYRVSVEYDSSTQELAAAIRLRDSETKTLLGRLLIPNAGTFAADMTRLGSSNNRKGKFQVANAESTVRIDNLSLYVTCPPHEFELNDKSRPAVANFGVRRLADIQGTVWEDLDGDGKRTEKERGLAGRTVYVDHDRNGRLDPGDARAETDETGNYRLANVRQGTHAVAIKPSASFNQTMPADHAWLKYGGSHYALTAMYGPWSLCEADAQAAGGHLVTIEDAEENAWLAEQFRDSFTAKQHGVALNSAVWIGLNRSRSGWSWASGLESDFRPGWWNREPYQGVGTDHVALLTSKQRRGVWHNGLSRQSIPGDFPRGVIELPPGQAPRKLRSHVIEIDAGEHRSNVNFGLRRRQP